MCQGYSLKKQNPEICIYDRYTPEIFCLPQQTEECLLVPLVENLCVTEVSPVMPFHHPYDDI